MNRRTLMGAVVGAAFASADFGRASAAEDATIVVGGKDFTEELLTASMTSQLLRAHGYTVKETTGMGSTLLRQAMMHGEVDVCWEYTGTALTVYDKIKTRLTPEQTYETVKKLDAAKGIIWLDPSKANDTYALGMNRPQAGQLQISSISDLARVINAGKKLTFATDPEFAYRPDGLKPLEQTYGFNFGMSNLKFMAIGLTYQALHDHQVDVAMVYSTDGRIQEFDFIVLKDDKNFFPSYAMVPVIRKETLDANPGLADLLNKLSAGLDDQTMTSLNAAVDVEKQSVQVVAQNFLRSIHLL
jgi:osmoprotectant transport system substrate-binding protein